MNTWKKLCNRGLSFLLATAMTLSLLPAGVGAIDTTNSTGFIDVSATESSIKYDATSGTISGNIVWGAAATAPIRVALMFSMF